MHLTFSKVNDSLQTTELNYPHSSCRIQRQLEEMLSKLFLVTYCGDVINIGPMIFTLLKEGLSPSSTVLVLSILTFFAQCYWWCRLAEYFQENVEVEEHLTDLVMNMPYAKQHHSYYCQLRSSLMILKMCIRNINSVKMVTGWTINVEVFTRLLNISYSALNFLINIDR
nr:uncharacterized protein LOC115269605 [Aedes albopictus]